jgi:hypothetical protein
MANEPTFNDRLKHISTAKIHSSYESQIGKDLALVSALAKTMVMIGVEKILPPANDLPSGGQNIRGDDTTNLRQHLKSAVDVTNALASTLTQLGSEPADAAQRNTFQYGFSVHARRFLENWSALMPAFEATTGTDPRERINSYMTEIEHAKKKADETLAAIQEAAAKTGASKHAGQFYTLHKQYLKNARSALIGLVLLSLMFISAVVASSVWTFSIPSDDHARLFQVIIGKVLALSVIYFLIVLAAKSYRANTHLAAVNLHRATALQTFETFVNSTTDEQTRNAILMETTRSIYTHVSTGFLGNEEAPSSTQVVEILKSLGPTQQS